MVDKLGVEFSSMKGKISGDVYLGGGKGRHNYMVR